MENDDLIFVIKEIEHDIFKRVENDLIVGLDINLIDSLIGFKFEFTHLDDSKFIVESNNIIKQDDIKVIKNKGMPYNAQNEVFGDLIFKFNIIYPDTIDANSFNKLVDSLPESIFDSCIDKNLKNLKLENYIKKNNNQQQHHPPNSCQQQ